MTSKTSSRVVKFKPVRHFAAETIRSLWWLPLLHIAALSVFMPVMNVADSSSAYLNFVGNEYGAVFSLYPAKYSKLYPELTIIFAVISALCCFGFLFSKRISGAYLTLGISRAKLFAVRFTFGICSLALGNLIPLALCCVMNIYKAGVCAALFVFAAKVFLLLFTVAAVAFSLSALAAALCGGIAGYIFGAFGLCYLPNLVLLCWQSLCSRFLYGSVWAARYMDENADYYGNIFEHYAFLRPDGAFSDSISSLASLATNKTLADPQFSLNWTLTAVMLCVAALSAFFALLAFKRRPAEYSGSGLMYPAFTRLAAAIFAIPLCSTLFYLPLSRPVQAILFVLASAVLYLLISLMITAAVRPSLRGLYIYGGSAVCALTAAAVMYCGGLGYSDRLPAASEVISATVTYTGAPQNMTINNILWSSEPGSMSKRYYIPYYSTGVRPSSLVSLTGSEDIEKLISLHSLMAKGVTREISGAETEDYGSTVVYADVYVTYNLADGGTLLRYYPCLPLSTLDALLALDETDAYHDMYTELHTLAELSPDIQQPIPAYSAHSNPDYIEISAADNMLTAFTPLSLSAEDKISLFEAINADKSVESAEERYYPESECLGVLIIKNTSDGLLYSEDNLHNPPLGDYLEYIYVYEGDDSLLEWLRERGFDAYFDSVYTVTSVTEFKWSQYAEYYNSFDDADLCRIYQSPFDNDWTAKCTLLRVRDEEEYTALLDRARLMYSTLRGGSLLRVCYRRSDGSEGVTVKFLPG